MFLLLIILAQPPYLVDEVTDFELPLEQRSLFQDKKEGERVNE